MKEFRNYEMVAKVDGNNVTVINKFGNRYKAWFDDNHNLVAKSALALSYCMRAQRTFGF